MHCVYFRRAGAMLLALAMLLCACTAPQDAPSTAEDPPTVDPLPTETVDTVPPVIVGAADLITEVGVSVSYRSGVTAEDETDGAVALEIDASAVDLSTAGYYPVVYRAVDRSGNETSVTVTLVVKEPLPDENAEPGESQPDGNTTPAESQPTPAEDAKIVVTQEMLDGVTTAILAKITDASMTKYDMAHAIYTYVNTHIKYVSTSDKTDWVRGAYLGLTRGKGDCYNYWAASKALLTAAGIDNLDLERVGGATQHFWNLVNVGDGWYHFDTCWHPSGYPIDSFMLTEAEVRAYTQKLADETNRVNYFTYDYDACPVYVEGTPVDEPVTEPTDPTEPTEPTGPVDEPPTEPVEGEPTEPAEPTEGEPTDPAEPTEGEPTDPAEPTEGEPTEPTGEQPDDPAEPTEPTEPTDPTEPVDEQPDEPDEPPADDNTGDTAPTDPTEPEPAPGDDGETEDGNAAQRIGIS